jgi:hypothetical protein
VHFVYTPEGGERQEWPFSPRKLKASEAESLEKRAGWDLEEFMEHLAKGSILARRALLWMFLRRVHLSLRFEDVDFTVDEVEVQFDKGELTAIRAEVEKMPDGPEREKALATIDEQLLTAPDAVGKAPASGVA